MLSTHHTAYVGLGANLGDSSASITLALAQLNHIPNTCVSASSALRTTKPWQASGPDYTNAVAQLITQLDPESLLNALQAIEQQFGRVRSYRNAPRNLDLDLLLFDELIYTSASLTLPHPRMHERTFVLEPLLELNPDINIPGIGLASASFKKCLSV